MFYVYILYSQSYNRYYVGQTSHLENRLLRHNKRYVRSTKAYVPWELVYIETMLYRRDAIKREHYLKSLKSKKKIIELVKAS